MRPKLRKYLKLFFVKVIKSKLKCYRFSMNAKHDLSIMTSLKNPYARKLKKSVTTRLGEYVIVSFKIMSEDIGVPY